jgi:hypothetical protein
MAVPTRWRADSWSLATRSWMGRPCAGPRGPVRRLAWGPVRARSLSPGTERAHENQRARQQAGRAPPANDGPSSAWAPRRAPKSAGARVWIAAVTHLKRSAGAGESSPTPTRHAIRPPLARFSWRIIPTEPTDTRLCGRFEPLSPRGREVGERGRRRRRRASPPPASSSPA